MHGAAGRRDLDRAVDRLDLGARRPQPVEQLGRRGGQLADQPVVRLDGHRRGRGDHGEEARQPAGLRGQAAVVAVGDDQLAAAGESGQRRPAPGRGRAARSRGCGPPGRCRSRRARRPRRSPRASAACSSSPRPVCSSSTGESRWPSASASATRSRTLSMKTSSLRMTRPGSSALVEIWSVSTIANSPYAGSLAGRADPVEHHHLLGRGVAAVGLRLGAAGPPRPAARRGTTCPGSRAPGAASRWRARCAGSPR